MPAPYSVCTVTANTIASGAACDAWYAARASTTRWLYASSTPAVGEAARGTMKQPEREAARATSDAAEVRFMMRGQVARTSARFDDDRGRAAAR